jgi:predicted metal-dependent hydrolase
VETIKKLTEYLRNRRGLTRTVSVVTEYYDPTLGMQQTGEQIEVIDFAALLNAIDEFAEEFK